MNYGSNIPGPKPPPVPAHLKKTAKTVLPEVHQHIPTAAPVHIDSKEKLSEPLDPLERILNRPTSEIIHEAEIVANFAVKDSKTVGGLGANILTLCAVIAASPWSWIAMLLFGPLRVWCFFYATVGAGVIGGFRLVLTMVFIVLLLLAFAAITFVVWGIVRILG